MQVIACNKCGEIVQDDPQEALNTVHAPDCGGIFVVMNKDEAKALNQKTDVATIQFGTKIK
jgi:predicted  nucleic acid-binding Zn-ribbon protein